MVSYHSTTLNLILYFGALEVIFSVFLDITEFKFLLLAEGMQTDGKITHHQFLPSPLPITTFKASYFPAGRVKFS